MTMQETLSTLKQEFLALHERKEDLFWVAKMGTADDCDRAGRALSEAEIALNRFLQDPARLRKLRELEGSGQGTAEERHVLAGWIATLGANVVDDPKAQALSEEIVGLEGELARARGAMELGFVDPSSGQRERATSVRLALMMKTDPDEARRKAAYEGLRSIETYVLENGFLDIVRKRNELGRMLGYEDYYDWRTSVVERKRKKEIFAVLDDLEARTRERAFAELKAFAKARGESVLDPWNFGFARAGDLSRLLDPYFSFASSLRRWARSYAGLGVRYRGATLTLDLIDRAGKYENGFMHGPGVAFFDEGRWRPARINFTSNAIPSQVGSGLRAIETLFHEGGHAAHFANIVSDAPCFAHEFAPTSIAYAETQSMFMDSLIGDADWRVRYAHDASGQPIPLELIEADVRQEQPFRGWDVRAWLSIPFAERALYEMEDPDPEKVLAMFRRVERETQGLNAAMRPILAVPHLLAGESSAYYHGYILAEMAVQQTRAFFLKRDGYLADNPRIGPDLAEHYWKPGNAVPFDETLRSLTGSPLSADALVADCNRTVDEAVAEAREGAHRPGQAYDGPVDLDARIRVVHGREVIADTTDGGLEEACARFEAWVARG
jgi:hypothetical protein